MMGLDWGLGVLAWMIEDGHWKIIAVGYGALAAVGIPLAWWEGRREERRK